MSSKLIPEGDDPASVASSILTEPVEGNGEFHDVDAPGHGPPATATGRAMEIPIELWKDVVDTLGGLLKVIGVRMADGSRTTRFCSACEGFPAVAHMVGNVTCDCICHRARELYATMEGV